MYADLLAKIRTLYGKIAEAPEKTPSLRLLIEQLPNESEPLRMAYRAAGKALEARETWLPWEKLRHFKEAMALFETIIQQFPTQIEVRFLRYTIQSNTPSLLGLSVNIADDKQTIARYIQTDTTDNYMKKAIAKHLLAHEKFTAIEKDILSFYATL